MEKRKHSCLKVQTYLKKYNLKWCKVQLSYAIGIRKPLAIYIDSDKGMLNEEVTISKYDSLYTECEPKNIIDDLNLLKKQIQKDCQNAQKCLKDTQ